MLFLSGKFMSCSVKGTLMVEPKVANKLLDVRGNPKLPDREGKVQPNSLQMPPMNLDKRS